MAAPRTFDHDEARRLYATGAFTQTDLAVRFGVSSTRINQIVNPDRLARVNCAATEWCRQNYHQPCKECGARIWKRGNEPQWTGLCQKCWGISRRTAEHGTESRYSFGCRCNECRAAATAARRVRRSANPEADRAYHRAYKRRARVSA